jgi:GNAT superfamily N-acetyltransferase
VIRLMQRSDLPALRRLSTTAGWNQTPQDWGNLLALAPDGCWVWEDLGQVVASTTAVCYGEELAWIGMVLVLPDYRRRGLARRLMEHGLAWLEDRHIRQVKLDATDLGRPLYEQLGFRTERVIERWQGNWAGRKPADDTQPTPVLNREKIAAFDRDCFGADRSRLVGRLLDSFPGQGLWSEGGGFILGRPGAHAYFLGPFMATRAAAAERLVRGLLDLAGPGRFFWDLFPDLPAAADLARELGFQPHRTLARMALHTSDGPPAGYSERIYGAAGFEYG